jgi:hypothetical protein
VGGSAVIAIVAANFGSVTTLETISFSNFTHTVTGAAFPKATEVTFAGATVNLSASSGWNEGSDTPNAVELSTAYTAGQAGTYKFNEISGWAKVPPAP